MNSSLSHLPARKQRQLALLTELICAESPAEMVILFGSHARGDWVDDPAGGYHSDYDVLVVVKSPAAAERHNLWNGIEDRARLFLGNTLLTLIVHDIKDVNSQLEKGFYFFSDVKKEGIVLYDSGNFSLAKEREHTTEERLAQGRRWFESWFEEASDFLHAFDLAAAEGKNRLAAFLLHQATERYYTTILLVFSAYKPKLHNLEELGKRAVALHPGFRDVFPRDNPVDDALFKLLKKAYIDARYNSKYWVTDEELATLRTRVFDLRGRTDRLCREKLSLPAAEPEVVSPEKQASLAGKYLAMGKLVGFSEGEASGEAKGKALSIVAVLDALSLIHI